MKRLILGLLLSVGTFGSAGALEYCEELWFLRNSVFHDVGYCFGSNLGQTVFGNEGCTGKNVSLSAGQKALIAEVRAAEAEEACKVDSSQSHISVSRLDLRQRLKDRPFPDFFESACIGWQKAPLPLMPAHSDSGAPIGWVEKGQSLLFQYLDEDGWSFVEVLGGDGITAVGWAQITLDEDHCADFVG